MDERPDRIRSEAKKWWLRGVSCSEASFTALNRCAGIKAPLEEQASHLLSGGMMHQGNACGLLAGAVLSAGLQAAQRFDDDATRSEAALCAAVRLASAFRGISGEVDCREITGQSVATISEKVRYMHRGKARECGRMLMTWAQQADPLIREELSCFESREAAIQNCANCATETFKRIASEVEIEHPGPTYVAGLAGGLGLLGRSCAALTVGILLLTLRHYASRRFQRRDSRLSGSLHELGLASYRRRPVRLLEAFRFRFGSDLCSEIVGRLFRSPSDHASFLAEGGCGEVMAFVEERVSAT